MLGIDKQNIIIFYNDSADAKMAAVIASEYYEEYNKHNEDKKTFIVRKFNPVGKLNMTGVKDNSTTHILLIGVSLNEKHIEAITLAKQQGASVSLLIDSIDSEFDYSIMDKVVIRLGNLFPQSLSTMLFLSAYGNTEAIPEFIRLFGAFACNDINNPDYNTSEYVYRYVEIETGLDISSLKGLYGKYCHKDVDLTEVIRIGMIAAKAKEYYTQK